MTYVLQPGYGTIKYVKRKPSEKAPDLLGVIVCHRHYRPGELIQFGVWKKKFDWGTIFNIAISNMRPRGEIDTRPPHMKPKPQRPSAPPREIKRDRGDLPF